MTEIKKDKLSNVTQLCTKLSYICIQLNNYVKRMFRSGLNIK